MIASWLCGEIELVRQRCRECERTEPRVVRVNPVDYFEMASAFRVGTSTLMLSGVEVQSHPMVAVETFMFVNPDMTEEDISRVKP